MTDPTRFITDTVRVLMARLATFLGRISGGAIKPVHITVLSFLGHIPAAWALWTNKPALAAVLITVFGLMDSLDGALAREQHVASKLGMYFDAVTDRLKEAVLYSALAVYAARYTSDIQPWVVVAVAASSLLVSYVKAKGEMAISASVEDTQKLNRMFDGGLSRYEVRMAILVIGLLIGYLGPLLRLLVAINLYTAAVRFMAASQAIADQEAHERTLSETSPPHSPRHKSKLEKKAKS